MYKLTSSPGILRIADGAFIPADPDNADYAAYLEWLEAGNAPQPVDPPTQQQQEEIKRKLLAEAMVKRDVLLVHLERLRTRAIEANNTTARNALSTAITSLENSFLDPRVVNAIDGEVKQVLATIKNEIGFALVMASEDTYYALLALDAL